ncbi:TPA: MFS transporter [Bacillus cereus]|nr:MULTISPECIES: MFS transporter [Bacillus]PGN40920.1 MFS transporter [Bacillus thuringiensis]HDR4555893.1 MFS transporter [Bacillus cereus]
MNLFRLHRNIQLRILIIFFNNLTSNMIFPFMSIYFAKHIGLKATSLVLTASIILTLLGNLYGGGYADKHGRKFIMVLSEGVKVLIFFGFLLGTSPSYYWPLLTVLCFLLRSFFNGLYSPAAEAMLLDVTTTVERKYTYNIIYWINNLSLAIGAGIGTYFFETNLIYLFTILAAVSLMLFLVTLFGIKETYFPDNSGLPNKKDKGYIKNYIEVFKDRIFIIFVVSSMLLFSLEAHLTRYIAIKLKDYDFKIFDIQLTGTQLYGNLVLENTICVVFLSILFSKKITKIKRERIPFVSGLVLFVIGYGLIATNLNPFLLIIMMFVATLGEILFAPIFQTYLGDLAKKPLRSSYMAINKFANRGSILISTGIIYLVSISSAWVSSLLIWLTGILGAVLLCLLLPHIYARKEIEYSTDKVG